MLRSQWVTCVVFTMLVAVPVPSARGASWTTNAPMPMPRSEIGAASVSGKIYVPSGADAQGWGYGDLQIFDPNLAAWEDASGIGLMLTPRADMAVAAARETLAVGGPAEAKSRLYTLSGSMAQGGGEDAFEVYDPDSRQWQALASLPDGHAQGAIGVVTQSEMDEEANLIDVDYVYYAGGYGALTRVNAYNTRTHLWENRTPLLTGRSFPVAGVIDGVLYVAGGSVVPGDSRFASEVVEAYDWRTGIWTTKTPMLQARYQAAATVFDGKLYVFGGFPPGEPSLVGPLDTVEVFDPQGGPIGSDGAPMGSWSSESSMPTARAGLAAATAGGSVFAIGGFNESGVQTSIPRPNENRYVRLFRRQVVDGLFSFLSRAAYAAGVMYLSVNESLQPGSCATAPDGSTCNDGDVCTRTDRCLAGVCAGSNPVVCPTGDQCHDAVCDAATGSCWNPMKVNGSSCSDGNACTRIDTCQSGACGGSDPVHCTAADQCHLAGTCNPVSGLCSNPAAPEGSACEDGNPCTAPDACDGTGQCDCGPLVLVSELGNLEAALECVTSLTSAPGNLLTALQCNAPSLGPPL